MIPFGGETVTLVQRTEYEIEPVKSVAGVKTGVAYDAYRLTGCSWRRTTRIIRSDNAIVTQEEVVCRIPATQTKPNVGDLLILGDIAVTVTSGADFQRLIEQYRGTDGAFVVGSISDNARPGLPLPHYAARGS